jgi:hypothetical protein
MVATGLVYLRLSFLKSGIDGKVLLCQRRVFSFPIPKFETLEKKMFLVRRTFKVRKGTARKAANVITRIGVMYEESGNRMPSTVYYSGGSVPGPADTVYMDWLEEDLKSPYRTDLKKPGKEDSLFEELRQYQEESWIEFFQVYVPN